MMVYYAGTMTNLLSDRPRPRIAALAVLACAVTLSACSSSGPQEDRLGSFLVAPGKFILYDCDQLNATAAGYAGRREVLRKAMADADKSPAGGVVNFLGYRTEYSQIEGNLAEVRREAASKNCTLKAPAPPAAAPAVPPAPKRRTR
jgi:hypothetical protein